MNRFSVRARLTLWNVGVVAVILIALGFGVRAIVRAYLTAGIDRELTERADRVRDEFARRIRFESGKFYFVRRPRHDRLERRYPLDAGGVVPRPDERPRFVPPADAQSHGGDMPPVPPASDTITPRLLGAGGEPLPIPFFRPPALAWDKSGVIAARARRGSVLRTVTVEGESYRVVTTPVPVKGAGDSEPAFVQVAFRLTDIRRGLSALDNALLTLLPLSLLVSGLGGAWLTGRALRPVREITLATDRIAAESLSGRLPVSGNDEFSELSRRFNQMLERLESSFERQRRFVADASHELRTPLAIVTANTSLALDDETAQTPESSRLAFTAIHGAVLRMSRIVGDLLLLARTDGGALPREHKPVPLRDVLQTAVEEARAVCRERTGQPGAAVTLSTPDAITAKDADNYYLIRLFVNLIENALRYTPPDGGIAITARLSGDFAHIQIADSGVGIAPEHLPHLFDRFYRADAGRDRGRGGTGLGLAIVQTIARAHGGAVTISSEPGRGTVVFVSLPAQ